MLLLNAVIVLESALVMGASMASMAISDCLAIRDWELLLDAVNFVVSCNKTKCLHLPAQ